MILQNNYENYLNIFSILLIIITIILISPCFLIKRLERFISFSYFNSFIPKIIFSINNDTNFKIIDKNKYKKNESKKYNNIIKYANDYKYLVFNNKECEYFIKNNFNSKIFNYYYNLQNIAIKNRLFVYCYLYIRGGIFMDKHLNILKPLHKIMNGNFTFCILDEKNNRINSKFIASKPKNPIFLKLIYYIINNNSPYIFNMKDNMKDNIYDIYFYNLLSKKSNKKLSSGINKLNNNDFFYLYKIEEKENTNTNNKINDCSIIIQNVKKEYIIKDNNSSILSIYI